MRPTSMTRYACACKRICVRTSTQATVHGYTGHGIPLWLIIWLCCRLTGTTVSWMVELQPWAHISADSMASCLIAVTKNTWNVCAAGVASGSARLRLVHSLASDAIPTEGASAHHMLHHMQQVSRHGGGIYMLDVFVCARHQSKLAVAIAICGQWSKDVGNSHPCVAIAAGCIAICWCISPWSSFLWQYLVRDGQLVASFLR